MQTPFAEVRAVVFDAVGTSTPAAPVPARLRGGGKIRRAAGCPGVRGPVPGGLRREEERDTRDGLRTSEAHKLQRWRSIVAAVLDDDADPERCFCELHGYYSRPEAWACQPDAGPVVSQLAERGYALGLASNYDRRLH